MFIVCLCLTCRLGGIKRTPLFIRQLLSLATVDFLWALWWFLWTRAALSLDNVGDPASCTGYIAGMRCLQMLSALSAAHIAGGLWAALGRRERVLRRLASAQLAVVPFALASSSMFLIFPPYWDSPCEYCVASPIAEATFAGEVGVVFCVTAAIHMMATVQLVRSAPEEVAVKSIQRAAQYLMVFLLTWSVFVVGCILGYNTGRASDGDGVDLWHNLRDTLSSSNGALNAAVYAGQNWRLMRRYLCARRRRRKRRGSHRGVRLDAGVRVTDGSLGSTPGSARPRGILASAGSIGSTPQRPGLAPPAWRGVAFSPSVLDGNPSCVLTPTRTAEVSEHVEAQILDLESRRSWLLLGADPLLHEPQLEVRGAGCSELNGAYDLVDCRDGRPTYRSTRAHTIRWSQEQDEWQMCLEGQLVVYFQEDDSLAPPGEGWLALGAEGLPGPSLAPAAWGGGGGPGGAAAGRGAEGRGGECPSHSSASKTDGSTAEPSDRLGHSEASASDTIGEASGCEGPGNEAHAQGTHAASCIISGE